MTQKAKQKETKIKIFDILAADFLWTNLGTQAGVLCIRHSNGI